jgi:DnaJ-class molecular chaperone
VNDQVVACLWHGIYERTDTGIIDRHECSVCKGDSCPWMVDEPHPMACSNCFGTGMAPAAIFDLEERSESVCSHCQGTGRVS